MTATYESELHFVPLCAEEEGCNRAVASFKVVEASVCGRPTAASACKVKWGAGDPRGNVPFRPHVVAF